MSTSGITTWELTEQQLVNAAYRKTGYLAEGQTLGTEAMSNGVEALNGVITLLQTLGMPLWKRITIPETLSATSQVYTIPAGVKVAQVVLIQSGGSQYDLIEKSLYDFNRLPTNGGPATPVHYTVQPTIANTTVSLWPLLSDAGTLSSSSITIVYQKKFDGMFNTTDTLDFPSYWTIPIIYATAIQLAPEGGLPLADRNSLRAEYKEYLDMAQGYGDEDGSLYLAPDFMNKMIR